MGKRFLEASMMGATPQDADGLGLEEFSLFQAGLSLWLDAFAKGSDPAPESIFPDRSNLRDMLRKRIEVEKKLRASEQSGTHHEGDTAAHLPIDVSAPASSFPFLEPPQAADELGRLGSYRVLKLLGSGGMGMVFLAEDAPLRRLVALKVMKAASAVHSQARQRFLREAQAMAAIEHDNVVAIHQVGEINGVPFLAMQLLKGATLVDRCQPEHLLPVAEVIRLGRQIAEGLAAAHAHGLIHRDIKPANLWLEERPDGTRRIKILDFGLARLTLDEMRLTQSGDFMGTPHYMAPEQARDTKSVDERGDLFSLGCVLYELCTGRKPFPGATASAVLRALVQSQPAPPHVVDPRVPSALSNLVLKLLEKNPADRLPSARATADALSRIVAQPTNAVVVAELVKSGVSRDKQPRAWRRPLVGAVIVILLCVVAVVVIRSTGKEQPLVVEKLGTPTETNLDGGLPDSAADMRVATGVLSCGGKVRIRMASGEREIDEASKLPARGYRVLAIRWPRQSLKDVSGIPALDGLTEVSDMDVEGCTFGDKEMARVLTLTSLTRLDVRRTQVTTGAIVAAYKALPACWIDWDGPDHAVAEWTLRHGGAVRIRSGTKEVAVTDVTKLPPEPLHLLQISQPRQADWKLEDLARLSILLKLQTLDLFECPVRDVALANVAKLPRLDRLELGYTGIGAASLPYLLQMKNLTELGLAGTKLNDAERKQLRAALPWLVDRERVAAVWVLKRGGMVKVQVAGGPELTINTGQNLPDTPFQLRWVGRPAPLIDSDLERFAGLEGVHALDLHVVKISDEGLKHVARLKELQSLFVRRCPITDKGLENFKSLPKLKYLLIEDCQGITGAGLVHMKDHASLVNLILSNCPVTDDSLKAVRSMPALAELRLSRTKIGDTGLLLLRGHPRLSQLDLGLTRVSNQGLAMVRDLPNLDTLWLTGNTISAIDLKQLTGSTIRSLVLDNAKISDADLAPLADMSKLRFLDLVGTPITGSGLAHLRGHKTLSWINLNYSAVTDDGLRDLDELPALQWLAMKATKVRGEFLPALTNCPNLTYLELNKCPIDDMALARLPMLPVLQQVHLSDCKAVSDVGIARVAKLPALTILSLAGTKVSDAALPDLYACKSLRSLYLTGSKVSPGGVAKLKAALPQCAVD